MALRVSEKLRWMMDAIADVAMAGDIHALADDDLALKVAAMNTYANLADTMGVSRDAWRGNTGDLFHELSRRVYAKTDIQDASALIWGIDRLIYGRTAAESDRGPKAWRMSLAEMSLRMVSAYRRCPTATQLDYIRNLLGYAYMCHDCGAEQAARDEITELMRGWESDFMADDATWMRRLLARKHVNGYFRYDADERVWMDAAGELARRVNVKTLTDVELMLWWKTLQTTYIKGDAVHAAVAEMRGRDDRGIRLAVLTMDAWAEVAHARRRALARPTMGADRQFAAM